MWTALTLAFIQGSTDYIRKILEVIGDKYFRLIYAGVVEDMGRSVNPNEVRGFGGIYWKEISEKQLLGVTTGKWMFGCNTNMIQTGAMLLNKNVNRSSFHII